MLLVSKDLFNRQSNSDKVIKQLLRLVYCDITVGSNIVGTASTFSFNLSENPASNCALFVNESVENLNEQRTKFLLKLSGNKFNPLFADVGICSA